MGSLYVWYYLIISVRVKLLKDYYRIIYVIPVVGPFIGSENGRPLGGLLLYDPGTPVGFHIVFDNPPGSNVR